MLQDVGKTLLYLTRNQNYVMPCKPTQYTRWYLTKIAKTKGARAVKLRKQAWLNSMNLFFAAKGCE